MHGECYLEGRYVFERVGSKTRLALVDQEVKRGEDGNSIL